jgi:hypothetical protein
MKGHFATAIRLYDGYQTSLKDVRLVGCQPKGKDRWVFNQPEFIRRVRSTVHGELAHLLKTGLVRSLAPDSGV